LITQLELKGIYAAVVTPFGPDGKPEYEPFGPYLQHLAEHGCHGVLLAGTTGEGPSLSAQERAELFATVSRINADLVMLAGTGAASLEDVIFLTRTAFEHGMAAAVIIPPFFYKNADEDGLFAFYAEVIRRAVPDGGAVLLYHNPVVCSVALSFDLIRRLFETFPRCIVGIKDSSGDLEHAQQLIRALPGFQVLVGDDRLLASTLEAGGAGAITAVANVAPRLLRNVYDLHQQASPLAEAQARLTEERCKFEGLPLTASVKTLLTARGLIQNANVRPPLKPLTASQQALLCSRFGEGEIL
jgi:4-hydroxy-tetrahydrodipicolinate synthase